LNSRKLLVSDLVNEIESQLTPPTHTVILSAEDFCRLKRWELFSELAEHYELHGSIYLRRQDLWLESWYNQHVRWPWDSKYSGSDVNYFLKNINEFYWIDYEELLTRIEQFVPIERMHVSLLDANGVDDSVSDFFDFFRISGERIGRVSDDNQSLSSVKIDILRRINTIDISPNARLNILKALQNMEIKEDNGKSVFFKHRQRLRILRKFENSNETVARRYFQRRKLFADYKKNELRPAFVSDRKAYREYIPKLLKEVAQVSS